MNALNPATEKVRKLDPLKIEKDYFRAIRAREFVSKIIGTL
jgi:hypothetical protein